MGDEFRIIVSDTALNIMRAVIKINRERKIGLPLATSMPSLGAFAVGVSVSSSMGAFALVVGVLAACVTGVAVWKFMPNRALVSLQKEYGEDFITNAQCYKSVFGKPKEFQLK